MPRLTGFKLLYFDVITTGQRPWVSDLPSRPREERAWVIEDLIYDWNFTQLAKWQIQWNRK